MDSIKTKPKVCLDCYEFNYELHPSYKQLGGRYPDEDRGQGCFSENCPYIHGKKDLIQLQLCNPYTEKPLCFNNDACAWKLINRTEFCGYRHTDTTPIYVKSKICLDWYEGAYGRHPLSSTPHNERKNKGCSRQVCRFAHGIPELSYYNRQYCWYGTSCEWFLAGKGEFCRDYHFDIDPNPLDLLEFETTDAEFLEWAGYRDIDCLVPPPPPPPPIASLHSPPPPVLPPPFDDSPSPPPSPTIIINVAPVITNSVSGDAVTNDVTPKAVVIGSRKQVFKGKADITCDGLKRKDLCKNKNGKIISRKEHWKQKKNGRNR